MMHADDTIAALATPPGQGGIAVIRISGKEAFQVANKIFSGDIFSYESHTAHLGNVLSKEGKKIDKALALIMKAPRSYTGEDVIEFQCHGGEVASAKILETLINYGIRMATPGEFTYRAFLNGKIDLVQAEAVQEMISAKSGKAFEIAASQLEGGLSQKIHSLKEELLFLTALFEAWVDFPEEGLEFLSFEEAKKRLKSVIVHIEKLIDSFHDGEKIKLGLDIAIIGAPNVGKSSLMNALLGKEKAIVTDIAGTTRDLIEGDWNLQGLLVRLIDTAGIRETEEIIEKEGIRRSHLVLEKADLVLFVLDAQKGIGEEEKSFFDKIPHEKTIVVWNKSDLIKENPVKLKHFLHEILLSVKEGEGIDQLKEMIYRMLFRDGLVNKDEVVLTCYRHKQALVRAKEAILRACEEMHKGAFQEILAFELREALYELGTILGNNVSEDILSSIFSHFCIGK